MEPGAAPDPRRWRALALVCVAFFMVILDVAIVNVALPSIQEDLGISRDTLQWIVTAYSLAFGGFLLLGGRAADLLGRRKVFMFGMVLFTGGSLACGLADSGTQLIIFRAIQGLGGAIVSPATRPASCSAASWSSTSAGRRSSSCASRSASRSSPWRRR